MKRKLLYVVLFCVTAISVNSQNLLNTNSWTVGSGSVSGFSQNGATSENSREFGTDPFGNSSILWKGGNDASSNADGGWNSSYYAIDHTETYRFTVWLKKTNSTNGYSYVGFHANNSGSLRLNDTFNGNPYFWYGDLPQLNKWYLVVGYVHGSNYNSNLSYGGIYDPTTGTKVVSIADYKFASTATQARHRTYLYYDTNTSDRQFFFAPRMEMVDGDEPPITDLLGLNDNIDTNLLDDSTWTVGCGSVSGFSQNGSTSENCRELGRSHVGDEVVLWKAINDASSHADGGWNTGWISSGVNHNTTYRYSVWIKKTNSNDGSTYFGFNANSSGSLRLNGTYNGNPYFWSGDLPKLNRWYLLVGYVHKSSHTGTSNTGGIYDGTTGEKIRTITDYKLKNTVTRIRHRSYLYYDPNTLDRQYFYEPRIDPIIGNEPTIQELLKINTDSKLIISYDLAGNQIQNFYCGDPSYCSPPAARKQKEKEEHVSSTTDDENAEEVEGVTLNNHDVHIYPNPTSGFVTLRLENIPLKNIHSIKLYNTNSVLVKNTNPKNNTIRLDLSSLASGVYFVHIHVNEGKSITKKVIKN